MIRAVTRPSRRILWILNHTTLMEWEVPMLLDQGFEVFVPKVLPVGPNGRTATVTDAFDSSLSLPAEDLRELNSVNFYDAPLSRRSAELINRHFEAAIVASIFPGLYFLMRAFEGRIFMRAFGHAGHFDYEGATDTVPLEVLDDRSFTPVSTWPSRMFSQVRQRLDGPRRIRSRNPVTNEMYRVRDRLHLAAAYPQIIDNERPFLRQRSVFLPVAMPESMFVKSDTWVGGNDHVLFVCPNIDQIDYYRRIYLRFKEELGQFPHLIAGRQNLEGVQSPTTTADPQILGFISRDELDRLMRECVCMFYHSQEPRHLHYHPLEAIVAGQPLIYMARGLLEALGGHRQPGLCHTYAEARAKIERLRGGDEAFRREIQEAQKTILEHFKPEYCEEVWRQNFLPLMQEAAV